MICQDDISNIKNEICENIGQKIIIKGAIGRKKYFEEEVTVESTYPNIFIVKNLNKDTNASFKYTDILTNELQVLTFRDNDYYPIIPSNTNTKF